jgi:hypothetical protein
MVMDKICSAPRCTRRPALQFLASPPSPGRENVQFIFRTKAPHNQNIINQHAIPSMPFLTRWQRSCYLSFTTGEKMTNKLKYIAAILIGIAGLGLQQAKAISYNLGAPNSAISPYPGPYVTLTVTLIDSTHAMLTYTSNTVGGYTYLMGDGGSVAANVNATSFSVGTVTATGANAGFTPTVIGTSSGQEDGLGNMNLQVNLFDGYTNSASSVSFILTNNSGSWMNANKVLTNNANGFLAGAHIFVASAPANAANGALATGFAGNGGINTPVPDGGTTVMLLGMALGMLGMARRFLAG